jgi:hypothetical protein
MKKKPSKPGKATDLPEPEPQGDGNPNFKDKPAEGASAGQTLYLKVDADGNPQWSRMTAPTVEKWRQIFRHPSTASQFAAEALPPEDKAALPADAGELLLWLAIGQAIVFSHLTGIPVAHALVICALSEEEKKKLEPRAARLLNKYGGDWIARYGDEVFFASAIGIRTVSNFRTCLACRAQLQEVSPEGEPAAEPEPEPEKKECEPLVQ